MIIDDHAAIPVEDLAARGDDRDGFDAIELGALTVKIRIANLDAPEAGDQKQKDAHRQILKESDLFTGQLGIVTYDWLVGNSLRQIGFCGNKAHKLERTNL